VTELVQQPDGQRLGDFLKSNFSLSKWNQFRAAIAFVKQSGTRHIVKDLKAFARRGRVRISVGVDHNGSSKEGLEDLLKAVPGPGQLYVFHNEGSSTFHPKLYLFRNETEGVVCVGSGNLTEGGLFTNYEAGFVQELSLSTLEDLELLTSVEKALDEWSATASGLAKPLTKTLLKRLLAEKYIKPEADLAAEYDSRRAKAKGDKGKPRGAVFASVAVKRAPHIVRLRKRPAAAGVVGPGQPLPAAMGGPVKGFLMTLQQTDVGVGQLTSGTSRRSPEIFIPLAARDFAPRFWGWMRHFRTDASNPGKMDRRGVRMRLGTSVIEVNMMTWPAKHDFRLRSEALRSAGNVGDILRIERADPKSGYDYYVEVIPAGTSLYAPHLRLCTNTVRNSKKLWGYY